MKIIVGSNNPVKRAAAESVLGPIFPGARFSSVESASGVSDQPWGDDETRQGAYNRAGHVLAHTDAAIAVGLEGGVIDTPFGLMTTAWCVVMGRDGQMGVGGGSHILLPKSVARDVRAGMELGSAMDALVGEHNTKQKNGAIGILTGDLLSRQQAYEVIIQLAVAPFRRPDFYGVST